MPRLIPGIIIGGGEEAAGGGGGAVTETRVEVVAVATTVDVPPMAKALYAWNVLSPDVAGLIAKTIPDLQ